MPKPTVRNIIHESLWLAPELMNDEAFLQEWSQEKFGCGIDEEIRTEEDWKYQSEES